ncbi:MAG: hypothetical protein H0T46_10760 [Deltaproteobacteria bacterium]|nr:hypothetical protein [Deltaproteobacteria bacterium]
MRCLLVVASVLAVGACKSKDTGSAAGSAAGSATVKLPPAKKIDGPSVSPVLTTAVTFVVPKSAAWWGEMNFSCYRAVMGLTGTKTPGEAFEKLSPNVIPAMKAAGIDLGRDLAGVGAFECEGSPCMYVVGSIAQPEKMGEVLKILIPGSPPKELGNGHYQLETPGVRGPRTVHVRVVPIQWGAELPDDRWSQEQGKATHVVFLGGIDGKNVDLDPLASVADPVTALAKVKEAEAVVADPRGRCIVGAIGPRDFLPGFKLDKARFGVAAPEVDGDDALMKLMGSRRTLDVEVELTLTPAPKPAEVDAWITQGRMYLGGIGDSVRGQFAGQGDLMDIYFDMLSMIGTKAFRHELKANVLRFSWRTDRIPSSDLSALEKRLEAVMGAP